MFQTSLATAEQGRDIERDREVESDKKRLREKERERGAGKKQDDNKSGSDFTDAYFINHVNKSW